jgi:hypothetical protein
MTLEEKQRISESLSAARAAVSPLLENWGIWCESKPGCMPPAKGWLRAGETPIVLSREMATAMAEAANGVNGELWSYEARPMPAVG